MDLLGGIGFDDDQIRGTADETLSFFFETDLPFNPAHSPLIPSHTAGPLLLFPPTMLDDTPPHGHFTMIDDNPMELFSLPDGALLDPCYPTPEDGSCHAHSPESPSAVSQPLSPESSRSTAHIASDDRSCGSSKRDRQHASGGEDIKRERSNSSSEDVAFHFQPQTALADIGHGVTLPRATLLKISSAEFDTFVSHLTKFRALSEDEWEELKRQRRLIRNREYSSQSRTKKKKASLTFAQQVEKLEGENKTLRNENSILQQEVMRLRTIISEAAYMSETNAHARSRGQPAIPPPPQYHWNPLSLGGTARATAATCLFVLCFSFALFHSSPTMPDSQMAYLHQTSNRVLLDISESAAGWSVPLSDLFCKLPYISSFERCGPQLPPDLDPLLNFSIEPQCT